MNSGSGNQPLMLAVEQLSVIVDTKILLMSVSEVFILACVNHLSLDYNILQVGIVDQTLTVQTVNYVQNLHIIY